MFQEEQPEMVLAFPGGKGTRDAIQFAKAMGYPVVVVDEEGDVK